MIALHLCPSDKSGLIRQLQSLTSDLHVVPAKPVEAATSYPTLLWDEAATVSCSHENSALGSPPAQQGSREESCPFVYLQGSSTHKPSTYDVNKAADTGCLVMGRRKPFIDKKSATTYSLLYNDTEEASNIEHGPAKVDHAAVIAQLQGRQEEGPVLQLPEDRRRELVSLGFPDDGYDYLKHLKEGREDVRADHEDNSEGVTSRDEGRVSAAFSRGLREADRQETDGLVVGEN